MSTKSESKAVAVGQTFFLVIQILDDDGDPATPDLQVFRKKGIGITGTVSDSNPPLLTGPEAGTGKYRVAVTADAGPGIIRWDWKGSGTGIQPFAIEGFVRVLKPGIAP